MHSLPARILLCWWLLTGLPSISRACMWVKGTTLEGAFIKRMPDFYSGGAPLPSTVNGPFYSEAEGLREIMSMDPADAPRKMHGSGTSTPSDWLPEIDPALGPIFGKKFTEARANLEALNAAHPNNYYIQANLGAVCELAGDDATALKWVEQAIALKPDAHSGTEWLHAAVLRAKLALAMDPTWLDHHTLSGIPREGDVPADFSVPDGPRRLTLKEVHQALLAHAVPRLLFVKPRDRIAAAMLTELARVEVRVTSIEAGLAMLSLAEEYGAQGTGLQRTAWEQKIPSEFMKSVHQWRYALWATAFIIGCFSLAVIHSRRTQLRRPATP